MTELAQLRCAVKLCCYDCGLMRPPAALLLKFIIPRVPVYFQYGQALALALMVINMTLACQPVSLLTGKIGPELAEN